MPPAATTGTLTASTTCGTRHMVVSSPMWPPDSVPSATTASAPARSIRLAIPAEATTGITLMPAAFHASMYLPGLPAPVVTTATFCSAQMRATSSAKGLMSMTFTPKGLSVRDFASRIIASTTSPGAAAAPMSPRPPALDTAAASFASATHAMPPWKTG